MNFWICWKAILYKKLFADFTGRLHEKQQTGLPPDSNTGVVTPDKGENKR